MDSNLGIIELVIFGGIALGWAFRELWLLRRPSKHEPADKADAARETDRKA